MLQTYSYPKFAYRKPPELDKDGLAKVSVTIVGAGPVGLACAIDLAQRGQSVLLLDDDDTVSVGSRGVCYAKRTLEVLDRLGCGEELVQKGQSWNVGRTFFREQEVFNFNLLPQPDHHRPGMINLQQYYLEEALVRRAEALPQIDLRWKNRVVAVQPKRDGALLTVETADGNYQIDTRWLVVADGARSAIRTMMGLDIPGKVFQDRFLIADVVMHAEFPSERWFWFDPPFHPHQSVLLHRQADNVYRIDFQLGWDADPEEEKKPERVLPRIRAMLGDDRPFELEWVSVYTFQCRRMAQFRHGRVLFVGDAAHQVSPFGARGANSGIQDADNLAWKLDAHLRGLAPETLLDSYSQERGLAADENIMNSTRSTDFITPKSVVSRTFRDAVLGLAAQHSFARALVNSGRLSVPTFLVDSPLNTADSDVFSGTMVPGAPMDDAPIGGHPAAQWLLEVVGSGFQLMVAAENATQLPEHLRDELLALQATEHALQVLVVCQTGQAPAPWLTLHDVAGRIHERYDLQPGSSYLLRPDQHVAARWRSVSASAVKAALARAMGVREPSCH